MTSRILDSFGVVPICEPANHEAGIEFDSFSMAKAAHVDLILQFGAITGDAILSLYTGAAAAALTTKIPFRYRLSSGDFKAASADLYAASDTTDADGDLTLLAGTYDHRVLVIMLDGAELDEAKPWVTVSVSDAASALLLSGVAVLTHARYQPALTSI